MPRHIDWVMLALSIAASFAATMAFYPALKLAARWRAVVFAGEVVLLSCTPLLVSSEHPVLRFVAGLHSTAWGVKLFDLHIGAKHGSYPTPSRFVLFILNPVYMVYRKLDEAPNPSARENWRHLGEVLVKSALAGAVFYGVFQIDWRTKPFFLEHCAKVLSFFVVLMPLSDVPCVIWRLAGEKGREFMRAPLLAPTPAAFWLRYNRVAQQFFYEDLFLPFRGMRFPLRALAVVFILSALVHELLFTVIIGRVQGYQTAFFLLQGVAVALTWRVRPRGWRVYPWWAATMAFNLTSSVLFFASANEMFPFYSRSTSSIFAN